MEAVARQLTQAAPVHGPGAATYSRTQTLLRVRAHGVDRRLTLLNRGLCRLHATRLTSLKDAIQQGLRIRTGPWLLQIIV